MYPLGKGPYYMLRMEPWNNLSCGGVRVNEDLQVLGWDMKPVNPVSYTHLDVYKRQSLSF